ncbi:hypothetical protein [Nocardioides sp.]|uniref:hypothetical protein n=1 Tax=Nocardioides sp. TaxID=35761 RepID=UPI0035182B9B
MGRRVLLALAGIGAVLPLLTATGTRAAWTTAGVVDAANSAATSRLVASHSWPGGTCSGSGPADASCTGSLLTTAASSGSTQSVADTFTNSTGGGVGYTQQGQVVSCAPARFANSTTPSDPLLPRNRVTRNVTGPWGGTVAAAFDGSTQYATDVVPTTTGIVAGASYSIGLWFRAAAGSSGGGLLSLNASPVDTTTLGANPSIFLDPNGRVRARLDGAPILVIPVIFSLASPSGRDYRDGAWHQVTLTVARKSLTTDMVLYVDGAVADVQNDGVLLVGTSSDSWWHVGWTDTNGLSGSPVAYFTGRISGVFRILTTLSAASVAALAASSSASSYSSLLAGAQHLWMLGDAVTSTYTGTLPYLGGNGLACSQVRLSWTLGGTAAFALTPLDQLAGVGWRPVTPAAASGSGSSQTLSTGYARIASGYDTDVTGLELVVVLAHRLQLTGSSWALRFDWPAGVVLG